ncbi:MAG: BatA domain-containing protein [Sandaracinaceae bacterium]
MGFEAPLALFALVAAATPIVAHLLRRRDLPRRAIPTIALLRRAEASSKQRMRVVDRLLLIVRVLLVAAAAVAIAGPFLRVTLAYGDGTVASMVIVLDDSLSLHRGTPSLAEQAAERAVDVIESLPDGSEVAVVLGGAPARVLVPRTDDLDAATRAIALAMESIPQSSRGTDLHGALEAAERELAGARHAERRVLVISDLAAHGQAAELSSPRGLQLSFERVGTGASTRNAAIVDARATPDPTTPGMLSVAVTVRSSADLDGAADLVLSRGGETVASARVELGGGGAQATLHAPVDADDPAGLLTLDLEDAILADNRRGVLLRGAGGARVVVVEGERGRSGAPRFLDRALDLAPADGGALQRRSVDPDTFATMELSSTEVVVLSNVPAPSRRTAARLVDFVEDGGGLLIAPGPLFEARSYVARLGALLPARPRPPAAGEWGGPDAVAGSDFLVAGASGLERSSTGRRIDLEAIDAEAETWLVFSDGRPALVQAAHGGGRVALMATALDGSWSNFPYRPGFLPFVVSAVRRLAPRIGSSSAAQPAGHPVEIHTPAGASELVVVGPGGTEHTLDVSESALRFEDTARAGLYRVRVATEERGMTDEPMMAFVTAPPAEESALDPGPTPEGSASTAPSPQGAIAERPFARWLFLLVGLLALSEAVLRVARRVRRTALA